jgi:hypothetical protein
MRNDYADIYTDNNPVWPIWAVGARDEFTSVRREPRRGSERPDADDYDHDYKPVWPTCAVGFLLSGPSYSHHPCMFSHNSPVVEKSWDILAKGRILMILTSSINVTTASQIKQSEAKQSKTHECLVSRELTEITAWPYEIRASITVPNKQMVTSGESSTNVRQM